MNFETAFQRVVGTEGGYTRLATDKGNWTGGKIGVGKLKGTKFGISAKSYPDLDIENLTLADAHAIYLTDYWTKIRAEELPTQLRYDVFDLAVNSGVRRAIEFLQQAAAVEVDGDFGPKTLHAVKGINPYLLLRRMDGYRLQLMTDDAKWPVFGRGWVIRVIKNMIGAA